VISECNSGPKILNSLSNGDESIHNSNNVDQSFFVDAGCFAGGTTGWGLVCYDSRDSVRFSACFADNIEVEPVVAEVMGSDGVYSLLWTID